MGSPLTTYKLAWHVQLSSALIELMDQMDQMFDDFYCGVFVYWGGQVRLCDPVQGQGPKKKSNTKAKL